MATEIKRLTIGRLADSAGLGVETVRFYERKGLLEEPPRNASGYRQYPAETVIRLRFIKRAKELGFSLKEIKELLALRHNANATCADVREQAEVKLRDIEEKIRDLGRMKEALAHLTCQCQGIGPVSQCPILSALEPPGKQR